MFRSYFASPKWALWAYGGAAFLLASLYTQVQITVMINEWYKDFYDILQKPQQYSIDEFWSMLLYFFKLAIPYIFIATITAFFTRHYAFRWRKAITLDYLPRWRTVTHEIEGASQRIQEDVARFGKITESLGLQVARAVMTLVSFLPVLWGLSVNIHVKWIEDWAGPVSGILVWAVIVVSFGSMLISWFVGILLPGLEYNNQRVEAAFRKKLVYAEDDKENHASMPVLLELFTGIEFNYRRLFWHYGYFDLWIHLYDQCMTVVPYVIVAPSLFTGVITLGALMQTSNAFSKVHTSFTIFTHNWTAITELRSIRKRLKEFEKNLRPVG